MTRSTSFAALAFSALTAGALAAGPAESDDLVRMLIGHTSFEDKHWQRLQGGGAVAALSSSGDPAQVSLVGAVRLDVPPETFVERFKQIERIERGKTVRQIGRFSATPCLEDLAGLTLDARDVDSLRDCRPGDCGLQLPSDAIERMRAALQTHARDGDATPVALREYRRFLIELISDYRRHGLSSLDGYHDKEEPLSIGAAFDRLIGRPGAPIRHVPELTHAIRSYPQPLGNAEDFFYWSTLDFGLKPTLRVNHVVIHPAGARQDGLRYAIASKQIYASHYFDAALELRLVLADPERDHGSILVYSSEARSRALTGIIGGLLRGQVRSKARAALEHYLNTTKTAVEGRRGN